MGFSGSVNGTWILVFANVNGPMVPFLKMALPL